MASGVADETGRFRVGFFDERVGPIEPEDFQLRAPMGELLDVEQRRAEFRQFQFLGAISDDIVVGCALTKSRLLPAGFAYVCRMRNCMWIDGRIHRVGGTVFEFDPDDWDRPWEIRTVDGSAELRFRPAHGYHATGGGAEVATNFHQLFGVFHGVLRTPDGATVEIDALPGFAESQYLRW